MKFSTKYNSDSSETNYQLRSAKAHFCYAYYFLFFVIFLFFISCQSKTNENTVFTELSPEKTGVTFANNITEDDKNNIIQYLYYYNGGGVAAGDVNNDGLPDLYFTANQGQNKLYLNKGNSEVSGQELKFEDATEAAGVGGKGNWTTGVTMADVNGDGYLDIYVCNVGNYKGFTGRNELFINNKNGTFTEKAAAFNLAFQGLATQAAFFDYDNDGDLD
jgi:enediyne biosynthesis protein E4